MYVRIVGKIQRHLWTTFSSKTRNLLKLKLEWWSQVNGDHAQRTVLLMPMGGRGCSQVRETLEVLQEKATNSCEVASNRTPHRSASQAKPSTLLNATSALEVHEHRTPNMLSSLAELFHHLPLSLPATPSLGFEWTSKILNDSSKGAQTSHSPRTPPRWRRSLVMEEPLDPVASWSCK